MSCGLCKGPTLPDARCPLCASSLLSRRRADRLLANGVEIGAQDERDVDLLALEALARVVRRLGLQRVLREIAGGAQDVIDLASGREPAIDATPAEVSELRTIRAVLLVAIDRLP